MSVCGRLGPAALTSVELLAILRRHRHRRLHRHSTWPRRLLEVGGGSLRRLALRPRAELLQAEGIGPGKGGEAPGGLRDRRAARPAKAVPPAPRIREPEDVVRLFQAGSAISRSKSSTCWRSTARARCCGRVLVTRGLLNSSLVHPREVFRAAIAEAAAGIIVVHNHPSGDPTPSGEDRAITRQLAEAGRLLDLPLYDHVIIAGDRFASLATLGLL